MTDTLSPDDTTGDHGLLLSFLAARDVSCPTCGYNLRDLREPRCPECGEPLSLRVQQTDPRISWPIAGLIGLSAGAGFSVMMVAFFLISVVPRNHITPQDYRIFGYGCAGPAVIYLIAIFAWLKNWRGLRRATLRRRQQWVLAAYSLPVVHIVLFALNVK